MSRSELNRKNALKSTGPKTPSGKAISSKNAVKHGAYSEALTMLLECPEEFGALNAGMMDSLRPVGPMETAIVDRMASLWWRAERAKRTANQDLWMAAKSRLLDPLPPLDSPVLIARATEMAIEADSCRLANAWEIERQERLLRHELMLEREFFRLSHELERLQRRRLGETVPLPVGVDLNVSGAEAALGSFRQNQDEEQSMN
jgi:hypothetical protein